MKKVIINGGPRKNWSTSKLLNSAKEGAESAEAEVVYVNLYDLIFTGCRSCMVCKRKGISEPCKCYWKDMLSPVIEDVYSADHLIMGSPVYFGEPTGVLRMFMERVVFPTFSYNDYSSIFKGKVDVDVFLTMNVPADRYDKLYGQSMDTFFKPFGFLNGDIRIHPVCDTLQVSDYSKYEMAGFSEEHKKAVYEAEFEDHLKTAFEVGRESK